MKGVNMTDFSQIPGKLDLVATLGDDFEFNLDFDINLSGYTFVAKVISISTGTPVVLTVTNVDLSLGKVTISLSKTLLSGLSVAQHHYYFEWVTGGKTRRVLAGTFTVVQYP
jgi:hypothetical protein